MKAQSAVAVSTQITDESSLVEGTPYVLQYQNTNGPFLQDLGDFYSIPRSGNSSNLTNVYYFFQDGNNWKIQNAFTGKWWPVGYEKTYMEPTSLNLAGSWTLTFNNNVAVPKSNGFGLDRLDPKMVSWTSSSANAISIREATLPDPSTTPLSELTGYDVTVSSEAAASLTTDKWYVMFDRGTNHGYLYENTSTHTLYNTNTVPGGSTASAAKYLVRLLDAGNGKYYLQTGFGNFFGNITQSTAVPVTPIISEAITIGKIANTDGHFYLQSDAGVVLDANATTNGDATVVGWGTTVPTLTGGNNDWAFYPVEFVESWVPSASEVYTINNTNTSRGAVTYEPSKSTKYVWSSGKSGATAFDASNVNHQWVIYPTGTTGQFYLFNVGAGKFAIPTAIAQGASNSWVFSDNAVAVIFENQSDGTKKIKMANNPVSGTNAAYMAVSNNYTGPIINYNDIGGNFTITKVEGANASTAVNTAVAKLVKNQTPLTSYPSTTGWYVIQIKSKTGSASYAGRYLQPSITLYNNLYPLTFTGAVDIQPAITDPTFFTHINCTSWDNNTWQLPDGRYLVDNGSSKFPTPSATAGNVICGYDNGNYFKSDNNWYADPYNSGANYFIGETSYMRTAYTVYPIDLTTAGLTAWQVLCDDAPDTQEITCTRDDVKGLTSVYKNGYFFLPVDAATPTSDDFSMPGAINYIVNSTDKTVTIEYDPSLAIVAEGVEVHQGYGTTGLGNEKAVLLRMQVTPFNAMENAVMTFTLTNPDNISAVKVYETGNNVEFNAISNYTNTFNGTINGTTATVTLGNVTAGTHYYWLCATVASDATVGDVIDAALTGITYDYNGHTGTTCDLSAVGNPNNSMKIFDVQKFLFLPTADGDYCRIPALITADDGSIVAACDKRYGNSSDLGGHKIDVILRRSTDGGQSWSTVQTIAAGDGRSEAAYGYGDPSFVKGADGKLFCLFAAGSKGFGSGLKHIGMTTSTDNGATWSDVVDITTRSGKWTNNSGYEDFFVTSGKGLYTSDGVIMFLLDVDRSAEKNFVLYSTDEGESWYVDDNVVATGANEAKLVELEPGKLLSSTRSAYSRIFNTGTYTKNSDGTCTFSWGAQRTESLLTQNGYGNNQDVIVYDRNADNSANILFHTITNGGGHRTLKLFISIDQGTSWKEVMQIQPGGSRYAVTSVLSNNDLGILFEDYSLETGREYPINFLTVTKEQIDEWYEAVSSPLVKNSLQGSTTGCDTWGSFSNGSGWFTTWTSNDASGKAGVKVVSSGNDFNYANVYNQRCMAMRPSANGATDEITITAPEGFYIDSYTIGGRNYSSNQSYKLIAPDGTEVSTIASTVNSINVENVNSTTSTFRFYGSSTSNYLCVTNFVIKLKSRYSANLNVVGDASWATLYVPFDLMAATNTKAYFIETVDGDEAMLTEIEDGNIPANTAVVLMNSDAATKVTFPVGKNLESVVDAETNMLKGSLEEMTLDLADNTPNYSLGRLNGNIGFYKFKGAGGATTITLGANKAYLVIPVQSSNSVRGFKIGFAGDDPLVSDDGGFVDGINEVQIESKKEFYNLNGVRVNTLRKGIYVVNGKKVVIK